MKGFAQALGGTACKNNHAARLFLLPRGQTAQERNGAVFGVVAHRTGVNQGNIGFVQVFGILRPARCQMRKHFVGVGHVHLAAVGLNKYFGHR